MSAKLSISEGGAEHIRVADPDQEKIRGSPRCSLETLEQKPDPSQPEETSARVQVCFPKPKWSVSSESDYILNGLMNHLGFFKFNNG